MTEPSWRINPDHDDPEKIDEVVMRDASVHLEDMGNAYMLIVENADQHIHLTIPHSPKKLAWVLEQYEPERENGYEKREPVVVDDAMAERMARALFARTKEGRDGWTWPINGEWGRQRDLADARRVLTYVLALTPDGQETNR